VETEDQQVLVVFIKTRPVFLVEQLAYYDHMGWLNASEQPIYALFNQAAGKLDTGYRQATTYSHIASVAVTFDSVRLWQLAANLQEGESGAARKLAAERRAGQGNICRRRAIRARDKI